MYYCSWRTVNPHWPHTVHVKKYVMFISLVKKIHDEQALSVFLFLKNPLPRTCLERKYDFERETLISCSPYTSSPGTEPQPRYMPWPRIKPASFRFAERCSTNWATQARLSVLWSLPLGVYKLVSQRLWSSLRNSNARSSTCCFLLPPLLVNIDSSFTFQLECIPQGNFPIPFSLLCSSSSYIFLKACTTPNHHEFVFIISLVIIFFIASDRNGT